MALLCSIATGNASDASTWGVVDATSYLAAETAYALATVYTVPVGGLTTPGAITISHLLVKLANRTGTTGTFRTALYSATGTSGTADAAVTSTTGGTLTDTRASWITNEFTGATVTCNGKTGTVTSNTATVLTVSGWSGGSNPGNGNAWSINVVQGTSVEINCSDLPVAASADLNGGWIAFKLATPVLLLAATNYGVMALTSTASQVSVFCTSFQNLSRALVTTTTAAPAAGDDMIVVGEKTGSGTGNNFTVTWNITASTDFGSTPTAANSLITPGLAICNGGTLQSGTTAATAYVMKLSNSLIVYSGGTVNFGTSGTPIPSGGSFTLTFDCGANVDYGLIVRNLGTWNAYGTKGFTSSPSNHFTLLTADEAAGQTVIGAVSDTTGWSIGDELCFSPTTSTTTQAESKFVSTIDSATAFTLTAGLTNAHSGTNDANGDIRCRIGNLTRNVVIRGESATLQAYIACGATATVTLRKTEFKWLGSATTNKRGINVNATTGTFDMQYCSLHDFVVTSSMGLFVGSTSGSGITFSNNVTYNINSNHYVNVATTGVQTVSGNMCCKNVAGASIMVIADAGMTLTNNHLSAAPSISSTVGVLTIGEIGGIIGTMSGNMITAGGNGPGLVINRNMSGDLLDFTVYRNSEGGPDAGGVTLSSNGGHGSGEFTLTNLVVFGNTTVNVMVVGGRFRLISPIIYGGTTLTCAIGIQFGGSSNGGNISELIVENGLIGTVSAHSTSDLRILTVPAFPRAIFHNTTFGSSTEFTTPNLIGVGGFVTSLKHDGTTGNHLTWKGAGRTSGGASLLPDTVIYNTASPSLRMYPGSATVRLESSTWEVAVASGSTLTPSVLVRYSKVGDSGGVAYVPTTAPRLVVKRNVAAGITADTVLATHGGGADWVTLSGTTVSVTDDCILEFFVDCDGTTGWINVDDFSCVGANPGGMKYWSPNHAGPLALGLPSGGGAIGGGNLSGGLQ